MKTLLMDKSKLKTLKGEYLVKIHKPSEKSGSLYVIRAEYEKTFCGIVEVLPEDNPLGLKLGDVVLFDNYAGRPFQSDDEELILLKSEDIGALIQDYAHGE